MNDARALIDYLVLSLFFSFFILFIFKYGLQKVNKKVSFFCHNAGVVETIDRYIFIFDDCCNERASFIYSIANDIISFRSNHVFQNKKQIQIYSRKYVSHLIRNIVQPIYGVVIANSNMLFINRHSRLKTSNQIVRAKSSRDNTNTNALEYYFEKQLDLRFFAVN